MTGVLYALIAAVFLLGVFAVVVLGRRSPGRARHADTEGAPAGSTADSGGADWDALRRAAEAEAEAIRRAAHAEAQSVQADSRAQRSRAESEAGQIGAPAPPRAQ